MIWDRVQRTLTQILDQLDRKFVLKIILIAILYIAAAKFGLSLAYSTKQVTTVWPPTGIAFIVILVCGYRIWPSIMLGAFVANIFTNEPWYVATLISIGNTLEALVAVYLIKRFTNINSRNLLNTSSNILAFVLYAAIISTTVSATIGTLSLLLGSIIHWTGFVHTWSLWWFGDMMGNLIFVPVILGLFNLKYLSRLYSRQIEVIALVLTTLAISSFVFRFNENGLLKVASFPYMLFPLLIWAAFRLMQSGVSLVLLIISIIAVWGTIDSLGPFVNGETTEENLLFLQIFLFVSSLTSMLVAAMVSERFRMEQELRNSEELNHAKDEFINLASHELRTPATNVKQYLGLILEGFIKGDLNNQQKKTIEKAYSSNEKQLKIVNDLLSVAKIDAGKVIINHTSTDISLLLKEVISKNHPTISSRKQRIVYKRPKKPVELQLDPVLFKIVMENLIDNASKYTPNGKKILVTLTPNSKEIILSVKDEGVGISQKHIPKLFEKFSRFDNVLSVKVGGSGIGLYWAKKIIDFHGGTIEVKSRINRGSTFIIKLPYNHLG